jgi:hypothetical protein
MSLKNPVTPPEIDPRTVRLAPQRLNHYATPGRIGNTYKKILNRALRISGNTKRQMGETHGQSCRKFYCSQYNTGRIKLKTEMGTEGSTHGKYSDTSANEDNSFRNHIR